MSRPAKWSLACILGMALLSGLLIAFLHLQAAQAIRRHEVAVDARLLELQVHGLPRAFFVGPPLPDRGWDLYVQARQALSSMENTSFLQGSILYLYVLEDTYQDQVSDVWDPCTPIVDLVHRAVRCPNQDRNPDIEDSREIYEFTGLCNLFLTGAIHLHRTGRDREAFDTLLLYVAVSHDTKGRVNEGCGWSPDSDRAAAVAGIRFLTDYALTAKDLGELAAGLDELEKQRPSIARHYGLKDALERRNALTGSLRTWERSVPLEAGWRSLFLPSIAQASALREIEASYRAYEDVERLPIDQRYQAAEGLGPPWRSGEAPATCLTPTNNDYYEEIAALAAWTHLKLALAIARYQVDQGRSPARLEELAPRYLSQIPRRLDPPEFPPRLHSEGDWQYSPDTSTLKDSKVHRRAKN